MHTRALTRVFFLCSVFSSAAILGGPGNAACPCVVAASKSGAPLQRESDGVLFDQLYGSSGCRPYGMTATPECEASSRPEWCSLQWCWVDASHCERPHYASNWFVNFSDFSAPYSYETCGNLDRYTLSAQKRTLADAGTLRVTSLSGCGLVLVCLVSPFV